MAENRPNRRKSHVAGIFVPRPVNARVAEPDRRPAPLQVRPAPPAQRPVTWSVFAIDGKSVSRVESGLTAEKAIMRARQLWAAEQDNGGDRDFAPGLHRPSQELAEQEVRETARWIAEGRPKPWDYD